jgi:hypothetical protein
MARYFSMASIVVVTPLFAAALTGLGLAIFSLALGGQATFGQLFAVVSHSFVLTALQALFSLPLNFARGSLSSPTSLGIFFPMLDETGFLAALLGSVDLFGSGGSSAWLSASGCCTGAERDRLPLPCLSSMASSRSCGQP